MSIRLIEKIDKSGKTKSHLIGIKTSQTGAFGFIRDKTDTFWVGLRQPEFIIVACVDDFINPRVAVLHLYDAAHVTSVFSRAYVKERKKKRSRTRKHTTGFFRQMHDLKPLVHPKYFGPAAILAHRTEFFELSKYMQLGPGDLSSSIKEFSASRPGRSESKTLLVRSLGIKREKLSLTISKSDDEGNSARLDAQFIGAPPANVTGAKSLFSSLSRKAKSDILVRTVTDHLERRGNKVEKDPEVRGRNTRRLTRTINGTTQTAHISIRTSQNGKIGYKRDPSGLEWEGLQDVQFVAISCLDHPRRPRFADIHIFKVETLQNALFSALDSREKAGIVVKPEDTIWLPLYERSSRNDPMYAGGGLACIRMIQPFDDRPPMLERSRILVDLREYVLLSDDGISVPSRDKEVPTFAEAKKLVALAHNVRESQLHVKIDDGPTRRRKRR